MPALKRRTAPRRPSEHAAEDHFVLYAPDAIRESVAVRFEGETEDDVRRRDLVFTALMEASGR